MVAAPAFDFLCLLCMDGCLLSDWSVCRRWVGLRMSAPVFAIMAIVCQPGALQRLLGYTPWCLWHHPVWQPVQRFPIDV